MSMRYYTNAAIATTLTAGISSSSTVITVQDLTGLPVTYPYTLILDIGTASEEIVEVTGGSGSNLQVSRGVDNSVALGHSANATVTHGVSARDYQDSRNHEAASLGVHGIDPSSYVVGTTDTQTLTNKTLTSPTINGATWGPTTTFPGSQVTGTVANANQGIWAGFITVLVDQAVGADGPYVISTVTFPVGRFTATPVITATIASALDVTAEGTVRIYNDSATGFTFRADFPLESGQSGSMLNKTVRINFVAVVAG